MDDPLRLIDLHTHILPEHWPDLKDRYGYGGWLQLDHHKPCCARMQIDGDIEARQDVDAAAS